VLRGYNLTLEFFSLVGLIDDNDDKAPAVAKDDEEECAIALDAAVIFSLNIKSS
jgi:hypothetical protein